MSSVPTALTGNLSTFSARLSCFLLKRPECDSQLSKSIAGSSGWFLTCSAGVLLLPLCLSHPSACHLPEQGKHPAGPRALFHVVGRLLSWVGGGADVTDSAPSSGPFKERESQSPCWPSGWLSLQCFLILVTRLVFCLLAGRAGNAQNWLHVLWHCPYHEITAWRECISLEQVGKKFSVLPPTSCSILSSLCIPSPNDVIILPSLVV